MCIDDRSGEIDRDTLIGLLADAEDAERRRLAEALHDDTLQVLAAANVELGIVRRRCSDPEVLRRVVDAEEMVRRASTSLRSLVFDLYPPDLESGGLVASLEALATRIFDDNTLTEIVSELRREICSDTLVVAYRITQEALANVRRHARAGHVWVCVGHEGDDLVITVRDDGIGFDSTDVAMREGHLGLRSMRERAESHHGWLEISRAAPSGTLVDLHLPDPAKSAAKLEDEDESECA
ncbi:MAG: putative signal transduction histidine kinase [Acidimicrobiaceae bacterium]|jgi:signal transduction histidine kinase|nr:putative signal transduction histidine kinase [Acidimicrobiaceae bacterium]